MFIYSVRYRLSVYCVPGTKIGGTWSSGQQKLRKVAEGSRALTLWKQKRDGAGSKVRLSQILEKQEARTMNIEFTL